MYIITRFIISNPNKSKIMLNSIETTVPLQTEMFIVILLPSHSFCFLNCVLAAKMYEFNWWKQLA